ncbi:MAG TPA: MarR family transcriptional regulator, partial [Phycisphaerales bacterium]|nr:MarR family transcriptional regulator [Phycisphaerales bacterium]
MPRLQHELGKRRPFDVPEQEAWLNLQRSAEFLSGDFDHLFKSHGLSTAQHNVLRILRGHGKPVPSLSIAGEMVARVPDITRLVDRLEGAGLVERRRCVEDRRVVFVSITRKGLELVGSLDRPVVQLHRAQLGHLSRKELAELNRLLEKARTAPRSPPHGP